MDINRRDLLTGTSQVAGALATAAALSAVPMPTQAQRRLTALEHNAREIWVLLEEPGVEDVVVNPDESLWVKRTGKNFERAGRFSGTRVEAVLRQIAFEQSLRFGRDAPILETDDPVTGARVTGITSPVVRSAAMAVRTHPKQIFTRQEYEAARIMTNKNDPLNRRTERQKFFDLVRGKDHGEVLALAIQHRTNIALAGSTGSGKTTAGNMCLDMIGKSCPGDRVICIEETKELQFGALQNYVPLLAVKPHVLPEQCVEVALRLKGHRIVVGEIRTSSTAVTLVRAWNTGHRGGMVTIHANSARETLSRMEELTRSEGATKAEIARSIGIVIFFDECSDIPAGRKLREVMIVKGYNPKTDEYDTEYV